MVGAITAALPVALPGVTPLFFESPWVLEGSQTCGLCLHRSSPNDATASHTECGHIRRADRKPGAFG